MRGAIRFTVSVPGCDRVHHVTEEDVRVVLSRLPPEVSNRLRAVHFNDRSRGARRLGYVNRGRREIALCALPPRVSLTRFLVGGQTPEQFGARRGGQWPGLAVRRFLLYDVFLHELGHLQVVDEEAKVVRRKFAMETKAQEFAMAWCKRLWSEPFDHPNPVHNPPSREELTDGDPELTDLLWLCGQRPDDADLAQQLGKLYRRRGRMTEAKAAFERALELDPSDLWTHLFLGNWYFAEHDYSSAIEWFRRAAELMPDDATPYWCQAEAYERLGNLELADVRYRRAVEVDPTNQRARRKLKAWRERRQEAEPG
jgi:hypothetical protein